jgi:hypothetical protein
MKMQILLLVCMAMATDGIQLPRRRSISVRFEPSRTVKLFAATMVAPPPPPAEVRTFGSRRLAKIVPPKEMKKVLPLVRL